MGTGEGENPANQISPCLLLSCVADCQRTAISKLRCRSQQRASLITLMPLPAVLLMSLRAQLQQPSGSTKPSIITTYNSDAESNSRCNAVLWIPKTEGTMFASAHANGTVLIYKKVGVRLWQAVAGCGMQSQPVAGCGRLWHAVSACGRMWQGCWFGRT